MNIGVILLIFLFSRSEKKLRWKIVYTSLVVRQQELLGFRGRRTFTWDCLETASWRIKGFNWDLKDVSGEIEKKYEMGIERMTYLEKQFVHYKVSNSTGWEFVSQTTCQ